MEGVSRVWVQPEGKRKAREEEEIEEEVGGRGKEV